MQLSKAQRSLVERVVNAFETGSADGDYGTISIFADGPHNMRQITYGRSQTTEFGNLRELVLRYVDAGGQFSDALRAFSEDVGRTPLTDNAQFKQLLRDAGRKDPVMRRVQDDFFNERYFKPAMAWADKHGFKEPLSALVIYDSFIHSGGILDILRSRFPEPPPPPAATRRSGSNSTSRRATTGWRRTRERSCGRRSIARSASNARSTGTTGTSPRCRSTRTG